MVYEFEGHIPIISDKAFIAESSSIIGKVKVGNEASVWFGAVLRADFGIIEIGDYTCVQDNVVIHAYPNIPAKIGSYCEIGHSAIIHGAIIEDYVLVGMGAIILNGAKIGKGSIIGAGAIVLENAEIPQDSLVVGVPAVVKKTFEEPKIELIKRKAIGYAQLMNLYRDGKVKPVSVNK